MNFSAWDRTFKHRNSIMLEYGTKLMQYILHYRERNIKVKHLESCYVTCKVNNTVLRSTFLPEILHVFSLLTVDRHYSKMSLAQANGF